MRKLHWFSGPVSVVSVGLCLTILACSACKKNGGGTPTDDADDLTDIAYSPTPYTIVKPAHFPEVPVPADNPMTAEGVELGRRLFYDPILSGDSTQACASCHLPSGSFTDNLAVSVGIDGIAGKRSAMSLLNVAYATNRLFWDGRSATLEAQALLPVEDPIEMHNTWPNALAKLRQHDSYPTLFRKAFGIASKKEMTKELAARAIAQFERILISSGKSKYDLFKQGAGELDDDETDGFLMFFDDGGQFNLPDAQCFHCHGGITLTGNQYFNNGLDSIANVNDFKDKGLGMVTGNPNDNGKFRATTLRNIALTAPYMHDGRFKTLEQVLDHYGRHGKPSPNKDLFINQIGYLIPGSNPVRHDTLSVQHRKKIIKFLHTLTDTAFVNNPDIQNPFK
ncbi:MAG: cytochrome-c peroxidase [Saprospiraceae bacterium]